MSSMVIGLIVTLGGLAMHRPVALDLFSGAGGMSLGFEQAGFDVIGAVEIDPVHAAVHSFNFPRSEVICSDISTVTSSALMERLGVDRGQLDVVFGGPPCQGFSLIGKRLIDDPRNALLGHFARIIRDLQPKYFVMENVAGLTVGSAHNLLKTLIDECCEAGYSVVEYKVLNAASFGVPQNRRRLFLLGYRLDMPAPVYHVPVSLIRGKTGVEERNSTNSTGLPYCPSVFEAIGDLPDIDSYEELLDGDSMHYLLHPKSQYARRLHGIEDDPSDYSYPRVWNRQIITNSLRTVHTELSMKRFADTPGGAIEPTSRFFRLHVDGISNTLRAGTDSKRGAFTSPRPIHPIYPRCISVREAARIHSFPDWFRFHVTKWHGFREVGNSVPPLLARSVAGQIIKSLGIVPKRPNEAVELGDAKLVSFDMTQAADYFSVPRDVIGTRNRNRVEVMIVG